MARFRLSRLAQADLAQILAVSAERWGAEGRRRYAAVLGAAPLHGTYYCEKSITPVRCVFDVLPY